jgi:Tol biopolymer transport system component
VYRDFAPFITPDGKYMIFYRMSSEKNETRQGSRVVERTGGAWGEPRFFADAYCLTTEDFRTFYFTTERSEETSKDLGLMTLDKGVFSEPMKLEGELNSEEWEAHGSISHDGSFILFDRVKRTFVSFRKDDDTWTRGYDLGGKFHIPSVSPDGEYIFFESNHDIYWVDAKIIEDLKPKE